MRIKTDNVTIFLSVLKKSDKKIISIKIGNNPKIDIEVPDSVVKQHFADTHFIKNIVGYLIKD